MQCGMCRSLSRWGVHPAWLRHSTMQPQAAPTNADAVMSGVQPLILQRQVWIYCTWATVGLTLMSLVRWMSG